jgi:hypothetical protein
MVIGLVLGLAAGVSGCRGLAGDACDAEAHGRQCAGDERYTTCGHRSCEDSYGIPCEEHTILGEHTCPSQRPRCVDVVTADPPDVVCLGEVLESCEQQGFVDCEDDRTEISCVPDEHGALVLTRGTCDGSAACQFPFEFHAGGCTDLTPPR